MKILHEMKNLSTDHHNTKKINVVDDWWLIHNRVRTRNVKKKLAGQQAF